MTEFLLDVIVTMWIEADDIGDAVVHGVALISEGMQMPSDVRHVEFGGSYTVVTYPGQSA